MKKLYTENQYVHYSKLLEDMANEDDMFASYGIHLEIKHWLKEGSVSSQAVEQMDQRMEDEFMGKRPELKRIK